MRTPNRMLQRQRILTPTEQRALAYQSQGSQPDAALVGRAYSLYDEWTAVAATTEINLFGQSIGQTNIFRTNMQGPNTIPGNQSMMVFGIGLGFDQVSTTDADQADLVKDFYKLVRSSVWRFALDNNDWDAYFHGQDLLPSVTMVSETAGNRVGDFAVRKCFYKLAAPVVIGSNTGFTFQIRLAAAASAALIAAGSKLHVSLDGFLTKKVGA